MKVLTFETVHKTPYGQVIETTLSGDIKVYTVKIFAKDVSASGFGEAKNLLVAIDRAVDRANGVKP